MKLSVFDYSLNVTKENSVATVIIQDERYCLLIEYLNDKDVTLFDTYEFAPTDRIDKVYSDFCIEQVNKDTRLQFAETKVTIIYRCPKNLVLKTLNFVGNKWISMSYNIKTKPQIIYNIVNDGKELVYSNNANVSTIQDNTTGTQIIPLNSKKWVTHQMKLLGIDFIHTDTIDTVDTVLDNYYSGKFCDMF